MNTEEEIQGWREYRHQLKPVDDINALLWMSEDPGWAGTRELLARMGWTSLWRVAGISGDILGRGIVYVLLPDETVASLSSRDGAYETCSVQEFADWDTQFAEPLWNAVVWLRYHTKRMRDFTEAFRENDEPRWREIRTFARSNGVDPSTSAIEEMIPDQYEEIWYLVGKDRRRFSFEIPYKDPEVVRWSEEAVPNDYRQYDFACWLLDAEEEKTSDWIFRRPYDWWDTIKPGWNPPFGKPTFATAEEAALLMMMKDVVRVASVEPIGENLVAVTLETDNDPSGQFPMTVRCERLANGRWRQVAPG